MDIEDESCGRGVERGEVDMESQDKDAHVKNLKKHRLWTAFAVTVFAFLITLFSPLNNSVRAIYNGAHAIDVFLRFDSKFLQKSPAGQYYRALLIKHGEEQYQIVNAHPEHLDEFWQIVELFSPGVEALVNGEGDTVRITEEQINRLNEEWEWEAQFASPSFREDVERELKRFPLDGFVGMTMSEALNFINANWTPDLCDTLPGPDCLIELSLVPNSNGLLSYYILNGIYFEIPSTWSIQNQGGSQTWLYIYIIPLPESPEGLNFNSLSLYAGNMPVESREQFESSIFPANTKWKRPISITDFQGVEFFWEDLIPSPYSKANYANCLQVFLYNEKEQIIVGLNSGIKDSRIASAMDNPYLVDEIFPNLQHIIESIRIWKP